MFGVRLSVRLSVCPVGMLTVTQWDAACDAARVHFGPMIRRTDRLVFLNLSFTKISQNWICCCLDNYDGVTKVWVLSKAAVRLPVRLSVPCLYSLQIKRFRAMITLIDNPMLKVETSGRCDHYGHQKCGKNVFEVKKTYVNILEAKQDTTSHY